MKPTIVFVPGAWLVPEFYRPFLEAVQTAGFPTVTAELPSLDPVDPTAADCATDAASIRRLVCSLVEEKGLDVVLVMHSYASMPGGAAAIGLSKSERVKQEKKGGMLGLVCMGAFLVPEGVSCAGTQGGNLPPWILLDQVRIEFDDNDVEEAYRRHVACYRPQCARSAREDLRCRCQ